MHVIPYVHNNTHNCYAYEFNGYWKDVGTLGSFWQQPYNTIGPMMILASPVLVTLGTAGFLAAFLAAGTLLFGRTVKKS